MDTVTLRARTAAAAPARSAGLARTVKPCRLIVRSGMVGTKTVSDIQITKKGATDSLEEFTKFSLDDYIAGKSKSWTFWNCAPSEFPWSYGKVEYAYVLEGKFTVQYDGAEPVEINAGDFVRFPVGETKFVVKENVRKFFTLVDE